MKVVHISNFFHGGAGTAAYRIHKTLVAVGIRSTFLVNFPPKEDAAADVEQIDVSSETTKGRPNEAFWQWLARRGYNRLGSKKHYINDRYEYEKGVYVSEASTLPFSKVELLKQPAVAEADIIHFHWMGELLDYTSFFRQNTKPVVWTCHDLNPFFGLFHYRDDEARNEKTSAKLNKAVLSIKEKAIRNRKAELVPVCPSSWLQSELLRSPVFRSTQSQVIPYTVDFNTFFPRDTSQLRTRLNIPAAHTIFLFVAQMINNYRKGFDLLMETLSNLNNENISLLIVGDVSDRQQTSLPIHHLGTIDNEVVLSQCYSLADVLILPSREDNLPNVMLEAMACGTPVISFDVGGMQETIINGVNGLKAPEINSASLLKTLRSFNSNKSDFDRKKIRQIACEKFSPKRIAESYVQLYSTLMQV